MGYERYPRGTQPGDYYGRQGDMDYSRDYGSGRDYGYSSARDYAAAGDLGDEGRRGYGAREYGNQRYGQREQFGRGNRDQYGGQSYGGGSGAAFGGQRDWRDDGNRGWDRDRGGDYHGSYAHDGRRFEDVGRSRHADDDNYRGGGNRAYRQDRGGYGRQPQGYEYEDRGFFARAGDEVRSWFGDEDAERRREMDSRYDERAYGQDRDDDYRNWRRGQIASLDRDYDEYRQENRTKFENEFSTWRTGRQGQRDALSKVEEHAEVLGSDGQHVGTVDKVRGDRLLLTKNDADAGGRHHSIPSSWIATADAKKVTLTKSAADAKQAWKDEESNQAMFGYGDHTQDRTQRAGRDRDEDRGGTNLNRSFSGTY